MNKRLNSKEFSDIYNLICDSFHDRFPFIEDAAAKKASMVLSVLATHTEQKDNISNHQDRALLYFDNISEFVRDNKNFDTLESWFGLVIAAMGNEVKSDLALDQEVSETVIIDAMTREIQRLISADVAPGVIHILQKLIKNFLYSRRKLNLEVLKYLVEKMDIVALEVKKQYKRSVSQRFFALTKNNQEKIFSKVMRSVLSSIQKEVHTRKYGKFRYFVSMLQSIEKLLVARGFLQYKKKNKQKNASKKQSKAVKGSDELYNILHGHDPNRYIEVSSMVANNTKLREEVLRLREQGLSKNEAGHVGNDKFQKSIKAENKKDHSPSK